MATSKRPNSKFNIDPRTIAINFDEIALLESALFNPKPVNILALKKRIPIALKAHDMIQEWQQPNSLLRKTYTAILMSEIARCLYIEKFMFNELMAVWRNDEELQDFIIIIEEQVEKLKAKQYLSEREKIETLNLLLMQAAESLTLKQLVPIAHYILNGAKALAYKYYLSFATTAEEAQTIHQLIEERFQMAENNITNIQAIALSTNATPEHKQEAEKVFKRYISRFLPENIEIAQQQHASINLEDKVSRQQYLKTHIVNEQFFQKIIQTTQYAPTEAEKEKIKSDYKEDITDVALIRKILKQTPGKKEYSKEEQNLKHIATIFQHKLNDGLGNLPEHKEIIIHGVPMILHLQELIAETIKQPHPNNQTKINNMVKETEEKLNDHENYKDICVVLNEWTKNMCVKPLQMPRPQWIQNTNPVYQQSTKLAEELLIIKGISEDPATPEEARSHIKDLHSLLQNSAEPDKVYESYNKLASDFPNLKDLSQIRNSLISLSFDREKLKSINFVPPSAMDF